MSLTGCETVARDCLSCWSLPKASDVGAERLYLVTSLVKLSRPSAGRTVHT